MLNLAELNEKLKEYRTILTRLHDEQESYRCKRDRLSKLSQRRRLEVKKTQCHICNRNIAIENITSFANCRGCERIVCKNEDTKCCEWISTIGIWECQHCKSNRAIQQKAGEWLLNQLTIRLQNPGPVDLKNDTLFGLNTIDLENGQSSTCSISSNQKVKVREFIEELLSSMLNGPLDDVSVGQLMKNEEYLPLCEGQMVPDSPSDKHFELRKLIQRILNEVSKLPEMINHSRLQLPSEEHLPYFTPKKYEQLLATAVLNKVVEDYRNPKNFEDCRKKSENAPSLNAVPPTINAVSTGSALTKDSSLDINHNNVSGVNFLNEVNIRQMSHHTEELHSLEDVLQRSLSESDESYLSDYIQKHTVPLPDLSDTNGSGSGPEDDLVSLKSNITEGTSWEENWLFMKRQLKTTESAIAMLVPSPTEDVKALIGDQIVDDVSDLSEADVADYDSDNNNNETADTNITETTLDDAIQDSLISVNSIPSNEPTLSEAKNSLLLTETLQNSSSPNGLQTDLISIENNSEKVEATNATLLGEEINHMEKADAVETDDVKLWQGRIQNAPKQRDKDGNVMHHIDVARAFNKDSQHPEYDRKEVPIELSKEHPYNDHTYNYTNNECIRNIKQPVVIDDTYILTNQHTIHTTNPETKISASVKLNSETSVLAIPLSPTQPLSPHLIALITTEIVEQSMNPHPTSISEDELDSNAPTITSSMQSKTPELLIVQGIMNTSNMIDLESDAYKHASNAFKPEEKHEKYQNSFDPSEKHEDKKISQDTMNEPEKNIIQTELQQNQMYSNIKIDAINIRSSSTKLLHSQFGKTEVKLPNKNLPPLINITEESQIILNDSMTIKPDDRQHTRQNMLLNKEHLTDQLITVKGNESLNDYVIVDGATISSQHNSELIHDTEIQQTYIKLGGSQDSSTKPKEAEVSIDHGFKTVFFTEKTSKIKNSTNISNSKAETKPSIGCMDSPERRTDADVYDKIEKNLIIECISSLPSAHENREVVDNKTSILEQNQQENKKITKIIVWSDDLNSAAITDLNCMQDKLQESHKSLFETNNNPEPLEKSDLADDSIGQTEKCCASLIENSFNIALFNTIDDIEDTTEPSSPEDTSTEAIAGSIDRVSSPEEQDLQSDIHNSNELLKANVPQNTRIDSKSNTIYEIDCNLFNLSSEAPSVQSTSIAVVTQQMRQYCEELKDILHSRKSPDLPERETPKTEELTECESKILTEPQSMSLQNENLEKKNGIDNHILSNFDYVEEENIIEEDVAILATENLEHIEICHVITVSPSVIEHAVKDAVTIENTASTEPYATLVNENNLMTNIRGSCENLSNESHNDDTQHALLTKSTPEDNSLHNNNTTKQTSTINNTSELHKLGASDNAFISLETDLSDLSQLLEPRPAYTQEDDSNTSNNEIVTSVDENLIPGSIAERDILKWRNASPIPNNPYSPDVLQKRLSESNRKSHLVDFDRLTNKDNDVPIKNPPISTCEEDKTDVQDQSLQSELGSNEIHNQRYGRDYYINDAKHASGSHKLGTETQTQISHSTDDEKSLLLSQKQSSNTSQIPSPVVSPSHRSNTNLQTGVFPFVKSSSCGNVISTNKTEDIFSAGRPVQVAPTDPILKKGTKLEYLSTSAHEVYLIPANEPITPHSLESLSEQSIQSRADESLTLSEDSDITRIYEIGTGETKLIQGDAVQNVKAPPTTTPPPTPNEHVEVNFGNNQNVNEANLECAVVSEEILEIFPQTCMPPSIDPVPQDITQSNSTIDPSNLLKPRYVQVKQLSPDTIKFFSPKKTFFGSSSNLTTSAALSKSSSEMRELPINASNHMHSSLHINFSENRNIPAHEFIIEKEVMDVLPSVKELAKCYSGNNPSTNTIKPIIKPTVKLRKDFIRQSSDMLQDDQESRSGMPQVSNKNRRKYSSTNTINAAEEIREIRRLNLEAYNRPAFVPMAPGHSITARSLSKQIRDELKTNATDDLKVQGGHISPERPGSPVFAPGHLRNSIQFFENLKDK